MGTHNLHFCEIINPYFGGFKNPSSFHGFFCPRVTPRSRVYGPAVPHRCQAIFVWGCNPIHNWILDDFWAHSVGAHVSQGVRDFSKSN